MIAKKKQNCIGWTNYVVHTFVIIILVSCIIWRARTGDGATYSNAWVETGCDCNEALVGFLTGGDFLQDEETQDDLWDTWTNDHPNVVSADRMAFPIGNATYKYNCHSYVFRGKSGWLNNRSGYLGTNSGCWKAVSSGTILSSGGHSCNVNKDGKCGNAFLQHNNDHVYGESMPTQEYSKQ